MAGKKIGDEEIDLDNMDFDDFDFDIPDFEDPAEAAKDRTPVENLSKGFTETFKSHLTSSDNVKNAIGKALPRGYAQAINVYDNASETAQELYHSVTSDIKPFTDSLRLAAGKISPKIKDKLPKGLSNKLDAFAADYYESGPFNAAKFKKDGEDSEIAAAMAGMFKAQADRDNEEYVADKSDEVVRDVIDKKRFKNTMAQGNVVAQGISRLVGYQDEVLAKWQQKTLELQYRQYFVAKDLLDVTNVNSQKLIEALGIVVTNTALPEAVKIRKSEMASQMLKERMINSTFQTAANYTRDFRANITKNITDVVKGFSGAIGQSSSLMEAADSQGGLAASAGIAAGQELATSLTNRAAGFIAPHMDKFKGLRRLGGKIGNAIDDIPTIINEWKNGATEQDGLLGDAINVGKSLMPGFNLDSRIAATNILDSDGPATFDNITRRSIIEIIPGWLSQINRWTKATATGKIDDENKMDAFNLIQGKFTTNLDYLKDVKRTVNYKDQDDSTKRQLDGIVDKLEGDNKTLSPEARKALKKKLVGDAAHLRKFVPEDLAKRETYAGLAEEDITAITEMFKNKFSLDFEGKMDPNVENEDLISEFKNAYGNIRNTLPNTGDRIRLMSGVMGKGQFEKLGLQTRDGNVDNINYDRIFSELAGYEHADPTAEEVSPVPVPVPKVRRIRPRPIPPQPQPVPLPAQDVASGCDPCESNETYFGKDSALLTLLNAIQGDIQSSNVSELVAQSTSILGEIALRVNSINSGVPIPLSEQRKDANWLYAKTKNGIKRGTNFAKDSGKWYFNKTMKFYKSVGSTVGGVATFGFNRIKDIGRGVKNFATEKSRPAGVYLKGMKDSLTPKLTQAGLDAKTYWDVNSKKFISKISEVTGEVLGPDGITVLEAKEYAQGIVTETGKTVRAKVGSAIGSVASFMGSAAFAPYKAAYAIAKGTVSFAWDKTRDAMDLYLKGSNIAALRKSLMEKGNEYFDAVTGDPIKTIADIKGAVKDKYGDIVVTLEDIKNSKGFWSVTGKAVKIGGLKVLNLAWGAAKLAGTVAMAPFKAVMWMGRKLKNGIKRMAKGFKFNISASWNSTGDNGNDSVTLAHAQLAIQEQMLQFMRDRFGKQKGMSGDSDGDGDRDGSIKDMLANRKAMNDAKAAKLAAAGVGSKDDGKKKKDGEAAEDGVSVGEAGMMGVAGAAAYGVAKSGLSSAASWVGKKLGGQAVKQGLMTAGRFIGKQVLWRGAQLAGTALLGVLGAPVALGALAVGAIGYGGYKLWKHIADKPEPLVGMRLAQYGINPREAEQISPIMGLEEMFVAATSIDKDGTITVSKSQMKPEAIFELFKIDYKNEDNLERMNNLTSWIAKRFMPVYNAHAVAVDRLAKGVKLATIDKDLPIQQALEYVKATRLDALEDIFDDTDTSPFEDELDSDFDTVTKWVEDAINIYNVKLQDLPESEKKPPTPEVTAAVVGTAAAAVDAASSSRAIRAIDQAKNGSTYRMRDNLKAFATSDTAKSMAMLAIPGFAVMASAWGTLNKIAGKLIGGDNKRPKVQLDALTAGRYKVYGLVDLDIDKVEALYSLEEAMFKDVFYDADKKATYAGTADALYPLVRTLFKISDDDGEHQSDWFSWFRARYLPAFVQFCTSVRSKSAINAADASSKLSLDEQHEVLVETSAAKGQWEGAEVSVWSIMKSPWKRYLMNLSEDSIAGNIEALKTAGKREGFKDTSKKVTNAKTEIELAKRQESMDKNGAPIAPGTEGSEEDKPGFWSRAADTLFGTKDPAGNRPSWIGNDNAGKVFDPNAKALTGGAVIQKHPGGGTGGDVNAIPSPTGDGWAAAKNTIIAAANMVGFDAATAATVAAVESGFQPGVKAGTSSAGGYFQFIDDTWASMIKKYGAKYGLAANASKYDGRANALMGMEFLKENQDILEGSLDRPVADTDLYAAHFLGPAGARRFLSAAPGSDARQAVGDNVPGANRNIFYDKSSNARTVSGVYEKFNELLVSKRKMHDLTPGQKVEAPKPEEVSTVAGNATGDASMVGPMQPGTEVAGPPAPGGPTAEVGPPAPGPSASGGPANVTELVAKDAAAVGPPAPVVEASATAAPSTQTAAVISDGKVAAAAQGIQPTASTGLTTPVQMDPVENAPSSVALAAMAQKQSSAESASLGDSIGSVKDIMSKQLMVQSSMDGKLSAILAEMKARQSQEIPGVTPVSTTPSQSVTKSAAPAKPLGGVPISTSRQKAM
jgi:hypothetical protein